MNLREALVFTFCDNFVGMLIIPIQGRIAIIAIKIFDNYPLFWVGTCAVLGSVLAAIVNWYFGRFVALAFKLKSEGENKIHRFFGLCRRYWYVNIFFASIPFLGPLLNGLAGVAQIKKSYVLTGAVISNVIFYTIYLHL